MKIETVVVGALETNCYLVYCEETRQCGVVDPGADPEKILHTLFEMSLEPVVLINTHGHVDHIGANFDIKQRFPIPLLLHEADLPLLNNALLSEVAFLLGARASPEPDAFLAHDEDIRIGRQRLTVVATPGHSPGSISLKGDDFLLSGDTLFNDGVGRTDLPGGSWEELVRSIKSRIFSLDGRTRVYPGHGPATTVDREKKSNPFVR